MGSSFSTPEKLYRAVKTNNVVKLQELLHQLHQQGQLDPSTRRRYLEFKDPEGRTPLLLAAAMNSYHIAGMLLANGADITYMRKANNGGTALHEAAANNHEAMVELLLSHGGEALGHPFLENYAGRTPLDLAVAANHVNIVRRLEKCGLFCGYVAVKVPNMFPFGKTWRPRWCVVHRRFPGPSSERRTEDLVLWMYKDTASCTPLCKVSVMGSEHAINETGPASSWEATLRLNPNHAKPVDVATKKEGASYTIHFRPISSPNDTPLDRNAPHAPNVVPEDAFFNLLRACNAHRNPSGTPSRASNPQNRTPLHTTSIPSPPPARASSVHSPSAGVRPPAGYPVAPATATIPPPPPRAHANPTPEFMEALPGETDEQFAQRLAAMMVVPDPDAPPCSPPLSPHNSAPTPTAANDPQPISTLYHSVSSPSLASNPNPNPNPGGSLSPEANHPQGPAALICSFVNAAGSMAGAVLPTVMQTIGQVLGGGHPQASSTESVQGGSQGYASGASSSTPAHIPPPPTGPRPLYAIPSMPMTENRPSGILNLPRYPTIERSDSLPSAPSLPEPSPTQSIHTAPAAHTAHAAGGAGSTAASVANEDDGLCVICLCNAREAGFLHGSTVHRCVCNECAEHIKPGDSCPMCRQPVERVLGVY